MTDGWLPSFCAWFQEDTRQNKSLKSDENKMALIAIDIRYSYTLYHADPQKYYDMFFSFHEIPS